MQIYETFLQLGKLRASHIVFLFLVRFSFSRVSTLSRIFASYSMMTIAGMCLSGEEKQSDSGEKPVGKLMPACRPVFKIMLLGAHCKIRILHNALGLYQSFSEHLLPLFFMASFL